MTLTQNTVATTAASPSTTLVIHVLRSIVRIGDFGMICERGEVRRPKVRVDEARLAGRKCPPYTPTLGLCLDVGGDVANEFPELGGSVLEHVPYHPEIDGEVVVHEDVTEAWHTGALGREMCGEDPTLAEEFDHLAVRLGRPELLAGDEMVANVQDALDGQLETVFDHPLGTELGVEGGP